MKIEIFVARMRMTRGSGCLRLTTATRTAIRDTVVPVALPWNWELSTGRVAQGGSDNRHLEMMKLSYRSIQLQ